MSPDGYWIETFNEPGPYAGCRTLTFVAGQGSTTAQEAANR